MAGGGGAGAMTGSGGEPGSGGSSGQPALIDAAADTGTEAGTVGADACTPTTCAASAGSCGTIPDGCGGTLTCDACPVCAASERTDPAPCDCNFMNYVACCQGSGQCGCKPVTGSCAAFGSLGGACACAP